MTKPTRPDNVLLANAVRYYLTHPACTPSEKDRLHQLYGWLWDASSKLARALYNTVEDARVEGVLASKGISDKWDHGDHVDECTASFQRERLHQPTPGVSRTHDTNEPLESKSAQMQAFDRGMGWPIVDVPLSTYKAADPVRTTVSPPAKPIYEHRLRKAISASEAEDYMDRMSREGWELHSLQAINAISVITMRREVAPT